MTSEALAETQPISRRLKTETADAHAALDSEIMAKAPFASREAYGRFLAVQRDFYGEIERIAEKEASPGPAAERRLGQIDGDLADLGLSPSALPVPRVFAADEPIDPARALGWLYVAEGSNLGAAFLLKAAAGIGLGETFGARHLAAAPEGRAARWRGFTAALDATPLDPAAEERVLDGAREAFHHVHKLVRAAF